MDSALSLAPEERAGFLGNKTMLDTMLSRVRHYCHCVRIDGRPYTSSSAESFVMDASEYVRRAQDAYLAAPGTCAASRQPDREFAIRLNERGVPLAVVENAVVLVCARRLALNCGNDDHGARGLE